jgi:hypothetical protein
MARLDVDLMEYANDAAAQAAYVSNQGYTLVYPPAHSDTYVKSTSKFSTDFWPYYATDPAKSLTGSWIGNQWISANGSPSNQRFHIDLGSAKVIRRIYYENCHNSGGNTNNGAKNFTLWGSNTAGAFAELTYGTNTNWTQIGGARQFDQHVAADQADPKYITVDSAVAYRYYALKISDNWGAADFMSLRRLVLQTGGLFDYSEGTIKAEGSYALKGIAMMTDSLNKTLTRTVSPTLDLSNKDYIGIYMRASRTGANIKIGFHDSGGTTTEITPTINAANTWELKTVDLSAVTNANKDVIDSIIVTIVNADADNTFYVDCFYADNFVNYLKYGRERRYIGNLLNT